MSGDWWPNVWPYAPWPYNPWPWNQITAPPTDYGKPMTPMVDVTAMTAFPAASAPEPRAPKRPAKPLLLTEYARRRARESFAAELRRRCLAQS